MSDPDETHAEYIKRIGPPRDVPCDIDLSGYRFVWVCRSHDYRYNMAVRTLMAVPDMCPMARLERWRARKWEAAAGGDAGEARGLLSEA